MVQQHREVYGDDSIGGDDPGLEFDAHLEKVGPERVWLAEVDGEAAGLVSLIVDGEQAEIDPVVVASRFRSMGIGRLLLDRMIDEARNLGILCLYVKPAARNKEAVAFYHKAGFTTLGHIQQFIWLGPSEPGQWQRGPDLFGLSFDY